MNESCVEIKTLAQYIGGKLSERKKERVEYHLSVCKDCRSEFATASVLLKEDITEPKPMPKEMAVSVWQVIRNKIFRFHKWLPLPDVDFETGFAMVCVRNDTKITSDHIQFVNRIHNFNIHFFIEKTKEDKVNLEISVFEHNEYARNIRINLLREDGGVISRLLKERPEMFENLAYGQYELNMVRNSRNMGNMKFIIDETGLNER